VEREAKQANRPVDSIPVADYQFFAAGEQQRLAEFLRGQYVYVEIGWSTEQCFEHPKCRQAMIEAVRPLAAMGVQFTVSTDAHGIAQAKKPPRPEGYAEALGVTPANTNTLVRELLARRRKRSLTGASAR
jgi:histidinol phosphatase-like PHP family hydrolase